MFNTITPIAKKYDIDIQLDPTFQPHLNLYAGTVFQLICKNDNYKYVIAKGGRYDELVKYFNEREKTPNGIGFSISIDNIRKLIKTDDQSQRKVLILYKENNSLSKALNEQKKLHSQGIITILELNPCQTQDMANILQKENNCNEIIWVN